MALICCRECGKQYSDQAESCPNCGYPTNKDTFKEGKKIFPLIKNKKIRIILTIILSLLVISYEGLRIYSILKKISESSNNITNTVGIINYGKDFYYGINLL